MDIPHILAELKKQRRALDQAIAALEGLSSNSQKPSRPSRRSSSKSRQESSAAPATRSSAPSPDPVAKLIPFRRFRRRANSQRTAEQA